MHAESSREWIDPLTETYTRVGIEDAYAIARKVETLKLAAGQRIVGRKIGITSAPMRELAGADEPDYANLYDGWRINPDTGISHRGLNTPSVEIELAFVLSRPLGGGRVGTEDVVRATDHVCPAIEVVDTRYSSRGPGPLVVDSVADAAWCAGFALADTPRKLNEFDIADVDGSLMIDDVVVERGSSSAVMGDPLVAVAWLANKLHSFGGGLNEGDIVLSGSFIRAIPFDVGQVITASFDGWADLTLEVTS